MVLQYPDTQSATPGLPTTNRPYREAHSFCTWRTKDCHMLHNHAQRETWKKQIRLRSSSASPSPSSSSSSCCSSSSSSSSSSFSSYSFWRSRSRLRSCLYIHTCTVLWTALIMIESRAMGRFQNVVSTINKSNTSDHTLWDRSLMALCASWRQRGAISTGKIPAPPVQIPPTRLFPRTLLMWQ